VNLSSPTNFAHVLEHIEIIRSSLRWVSQLDRPGIQKILEQVNTLREEILVLSRVERCRQTLTEETVEPMSVLQRRQVLSAFEGVFGDNPKLLEILETVEKAARTDLPILIEGESGTGKELLAKVIHANSRRSGKPFISVNCGAIVGTLLESELFGHVKGAFTGSVKDRKGKFEAANNGTIFLDELGEISQENQVKLLRVLESGEIQRVGSDDAICVNARVLAATNRNLYQMMSEKKFREDLYYRLSVICVTLPPLRERRDEIPLLIDYFCDEAAEKLNRSPVKLSFRLRQFLLNYSFRGNIRELRNIIYRISCIADDMADLKHLPELIRPAPDSEHINENPPVVTNPKIDEIRKIASGDAEKHFLEEQLDAAGGNITALAKHLNMNRSYLHTLIKKRGINPKSFKRRKNP
jgi:transcriptional regulator with GAF, ATPase, and Fis domain